MVVRVIVPWNISGDADADCGIVLERRVDPLRNFAVLVILFFDY